jgi:hypothetical protein
MAIVDSVAGGMSEGEFGRDLSTTPDPKTQMISSLLQIQLQARANVYSNGDSNRSAYCNSKISVCQLRVRFSAKRRLIRHARQRILRYGDACGSALAAGRLESQRYQTII